MDPGLGFCRKSIMSASGGGRFTVLGDPQSGLSTFEGLTARNEISEPKFSNFCAVILSNLETHPFKCAKLTDFVGRWVPR